MIIGGSMSTKLKKLKRLLERQQSETTPVAHIPLNPDTHQVLVSITKKDGNTTLQLLDETQKIPLSLLFDALMQSALRVHKEINRREFESQNSAPTPAP